MRFLLRTAVAGAARQSMMVVSFKAHKTALLLNSVERLTDWKTTTMRTDLMLQTVRSRHGANDPGGDLAALGDDDDSDVPAQAWRSSRNSPLPRYHQM